VTVGAQQNLDPGPMGTDGARRDGAQNREAPPLGRLPGRSRAVTKRPSPSKTTIGWKP
jgi:hypothetical protein